MPRMSLDTRKRVILLKDQGFSVSKILARLKQEQISITRQALYNLLKKHCESGCLVDLPKRTRTRKVSDEMVAIIDEALSSNDELTAREIRSILVERWPDLEVTLSTIKRIRNQIGWKCTRPHYCQMLRNVSLPKSLIANFCVPVCYDMYINFN